jgi:hypothetical protein
LNVFLTLEKLVDLVRERLGFMDEDSVVHLKGRIDICHTSFLDQNRILIACVPRNNNFIHTDISVHSNAKCHK